MNKELLNSRVEFLYGFGVRVDNEESGNYPVFGSNGIIGFINNFKVKGPGVIVGRKGSVGKVTFSKENFTPSDTAYYLSIKNPETDDLLFWYYYLKMLGLEKLNTHSSVPGLSRELAYLININVPDLISQQKIAGVLSALDSKIELNNRINAELEAMAKTIYDYWFVQFDFPHPFTKVITNKNGRRTELVEVKPYKSSGGKMVYNPQLKREIPAGWEVGKINDFCKTASGGTPLSTQKEYYDNGDIPWINSGELNNPYIINTSNFITKEGLANSSAKLFSPNTILIALYGATAGKVSLLHIEACTNQAVCAVIPNSTLAVYYLKFSLEKIYNYLINLSSGSARDNLSQDMINELTFLIPTDKLLSKFNEIVKPCVASLIHNLKQNEQLTQLRDWLLPMLMNGQVKVK
ncbi:MAG: type I restriction enzyme S subunit [Ignavibacteria bacterium]|nr:MAG: type I restriction enzyme S subunit [Ignavibacteria bacterium]KAF0161023.1 MAG: type I restriction enzyme S subunit [Ignavibacteria bacterium]